MWRDGPTPYKSYNSRSGGMAGEQKEQYAWVVLFAMARSVGVGVAGSRKAN